MEPACGDVNINEKEHVWMGVESDRSRCGRSNSTLWCWWRKNVVLFSFGMASRVQAHQIGIVVRLHCRQLFARLCYPMIVIVDHLHCRRYLAALNVKVVWLHCRRSFAALRCAGNSLWSTRYKNLAIHHVKSLIVTTVHPPHVHTISAASLDTGSSDTEVVNVAIAPDGWWHNNVVLPPFGNSVESACNPIMSRSY